MKVMDIIKEDDTYTLGVGEAELPSTETHDGAICRFERVFKVVNMKYGVVTYESKSFLSAVIAYTTLSEHEVEAQARLAGTYVEPQQERSSGLMVPRNPGIQLN